MVAKNIADVTVKYFMKLEKLVTGALAKTILVNCNPSRNVKLYMISLWFLYISANLCFAYLETEKLITSMNNKTKDKIRSGGVQIFPGRGIIDTYGGQIQTKMIYDIKSLSIVFS
jgi:hypothetical protein